MRGVTPHGQAGPGGAQGRGAARADVSFRDKEARVVYDPGQVTVEQMIAAVNGAGFRASVKRQGE